MAASGGEAIYLEIEWVFLVYLVGIQPVWHLFELFELFAGSSSLLLGRCQIKAVVCYPTLAESRMVENEKGVSHQRYFFSWVSVRHKNESIPVCGWCQTLNF